MWNGWRRCPYWAFGKRGFQRFNAREGNSKDLPRSGKSKLWDIENVADFWKKIHEKVLVGCQNNLVHQTMPYIHLENHTEAVNLNLMNWHLRVEWISVLSLSVILCMIVLSGELSHVIKTGSIIATLTPPNSGSVPINLPKLSLKIMVRPQSNAVHLVGFWRCSSLEVCSKRACSRCESLFSTTGTSPWNFEAETPSTN